MVGGLYWFELEHSNQVITKYILRKPRPSKLYDEEIWLKITAVYSELHEMYFESKEIWNFQTEITRPPQLFFMIQHTMCALIIFI